MTFLQTEWLKDKPIEEIADAIDQEKIGTINYTLEKYFSINYDNQVTKGIRQIFEAVGFTNKTTVTIAGYGTYLIMVFMIDILLDILLFIPKESKKIFKKVVKENE